MLCISIKQNMNIISPNWLIAARNITSVKSQYIFVEIFSFRSVDLWHSLNMILIQFLIISLTVGFTIAEVGQKIVFTNLTYTADRNFWNLTMWLNDSRIYLVNVVGPPTVEVTMELKLYIKTDAANGAFVNFFTRQLDLCRFLDNPMSDSFFNMIYQVWAMNKDNKIFRKCPIVMVRFDLRYIKNIEVVNHII